MKDKRSILLVVIFIIAFFPIPTHTTTWPYNSINHDFVSSGEAHPEECYHHEERWSGLLIGIQMNVVESHGSTDCAEMYKGWGVNIRCEFHELSDGYGIQVNRQDEFGYWAIPAGENAVVIGLGIIPLKTWYMDSFSLKLLSIRIASSGLGIDLMGNYFPNLLMFGECENEE